ncbi:hypothetical protein K502DRAFT_358122 [Neoconidiobolus thromboides FSU 785]|nr:hypothetical protein K502DRAFT_358122 [Neoconidiobolus thromboides FSU 785]
MPLRFDQLPDIVIEDVFKHVNPSKLFDLCFLNKSLFKNVRHVIKYSLVHSIYSSSEYAEHNQYQQRFIKENGLLMKHININTYTLDELRNCPNITSLKYCDKRVKKDRNTKDSRVNFQLKNLKKIVITSKVHIDSLDLFANYLNSIKRLVLYGPINTCIKEVIEYLNPNGLKSLVLCSNESLDLDGLDIIKARFIELKLLQLSAKKGFVKPNEFNNDLTFSSKLELKLVGHISSDIIRLFGDLKRLKSIKLIDNSSAFFEKNDDYVRNLLEGSDIITLGHLCLENRIDDSFIRISTVKEVCIRELSRELLRSISSVSNIQKVSFKKVQNSIEYPYYIIWESNDLRKSLQCKFIKHLEIKTYKNTLRKFMCFLSMFPNLESIKIKNLVLKYNNKQDTHTLTILPIVITSIKNKTFLELVRKNPVINWYKLE